MLRKKTARRFEKSVIAYLFVLVQNMLKPSSDWTDAQQGLWHKIDRFELDIPDNGLTFSERAARENAWSLGYTMRVIAEYKRFLFLAMNAGHVVCPSDAVDQIWHMHLTYTRSYWDELCSQVLGKPLHHGPTKGGQVEHEKYYKLYERTLASYQHFFGEAAPAGIWPPAQQRFGSDLEFVRINRTSHWVIPKPKWSQAILGGASAGIIIPIAQLATNPLDWTGPQFLLLFFSLLAMAIIISLAARIWSLNSNNNSIEPSSSDIEITPIEAAWLSGGDQRAVTCAVIDLAQREAIELKNSKLLPGPNIATAKPDSRVARQILNSLETATSGRTWGAVSRDARVALVALRQRLEEKGLVTDWSTRAAAAVTPLVSIGLVMLLGAGKIFVGLDRHKPIEFLILGEMLAVAALLIFLFNLPKMTRAGARLLSQLKSDATNRPDELAVRHPVAEASNSDSTLLWTTAMLGTTALVATPYAVYHSYMLQQMITSSLTTGGCGTSGCGGGSGGGGCGGGGCGGCGS